MLKNKGFGLLIFFSSFLVASVSDAEINCKNPTAADAKDFSLRSEGGSLANTKVQDQDGLGTCYANALSLALEANLGVPASYQQLAILYGVNAHKGKPATILPSAGSEGTSTFVDGGFSCEAFNVVKKRAPNYLCTRESVPIENLANSDGQGEVMRAMSEYYDQFNKLKKSNPKEAKRFSEELKKIFVNQKNLNKTFCKPVVDLDTDLASKLVAFCVSQHEKFKNSSLAILQLKSQRDSLLTQLPYQKETIDNLALLITHAEKEARLAREKIAAIGEAGEDVIILGGDATSGSRIEIIDCNINEKIKEKINTIYIPQMMNTFKDGKGALLMGAEGSPGPLRNFLKTLSDIPALRNDKNFPSEIFYNSSVIPEAMSEKQLQKELAQDISCLDSSHCPEYRAWVDLKTAGNITEHYYQSTGACLPAQMGKALDSVIAKLGVLTKDSFPADTLVKALASISNPMEEYFLGIVAPECIMDSAISPHPYRLEIPPSMTCNEIQLKETAEKDIRVSAQKNKITAKDIQAQAEKSFRKIIENELKRGKGNPVMLSICTAFMSNRKADSDFGMNCQGGVEKHAMHELNVIGYRCKDGKVEYQLQNSWGQGCGAFAQPPVTPPNNLKIKPAATTSTPPPPSAIVYNYDCESEKGTVWVPEDILVKNTNSMTLLSK